MPSTFNVLFRRPESASGGIPAPSLHRCVEFDSLDADERDDIARALCRLLHNDDAAVREGWTPRWVLKKPRSIILLVETRASRAAWIVKRQRVAAHGGHCAASRTTAKEAAYQAAARKATADVAGCSPVPVLATYPDLLTQVQEYVEGASLGEWIVRTGWHLGRRRQHTLDYVARCGRWAASLAGRGRQEGQSWDAPGLIRGLAGNWSRFRARYPGIARGIDEDRLLAWLEGQYAQLGEEDRTGVSCHGDFGPGNILITPAGQLAVIDFASGCLGSRLTDACYFLHQLWHRCFNPLMSRRFIARGAAAFVDGFGKAELEDGPLLRLEKARRYLTTLAGLAGRKGERLLLPTLHDRWLARRCICHLRQFLAKDAIAPAE